MPLVEIHLCMNEAPQEAIFIFFSLFFSVHALTNAYCGSWFWPLVELHLYEDIFSFLYFWNEFMYTSKRALGAYKL